MLVGLQILIVREMSVASHSAGEFHQKKLCCPRCIQFPITVRPLPVTFLFIYFMAIH